VILLDEPTRGLTTSRKHALADLLLELKREGRAVVMATHDVELAAAVRGSGGAPRRRPDGGGRAGPGGDERLAGLRIQINKLFRDPRFLVVDDVEVVEP
jgi:hypothetical protein